MKRPSNFLIKTLLLCFIILILGVLKSNAQTYVVNNTANVTDPWNNICSSPTPFGGGTNTLGEGIRRLNQGLATRIVISPGIYDLSNINTNQGSALICANNVTIESSGPGVIIISGHSYEEAIRITGNNDTIRNIEFRTQVGINGGDGNYITGCTFTPTVLSRDGVSIYNGATLNTVINNTFTGNTGTTAVGVRISNATSINNLIIGNTITRFTNGVRIEGTGTNKMDGNFIYSNTQNGAFVDGGSTNIIFINNKIGTNATGTLALGNASSGIRIEGGSGHRIGIRNAGNQIVANGNAGPSITTKDNATGEGIYFFNVSNSSIKGNKIGVNALGNSTIGSDGNPLGNHLNGIYLEFACQNDSIGGILPGEENIIGGNGKAHAALSSFAFATRSGIQLIDDTPAPGAGASMNNVLVGNYCGTNASGANLGNGQEGITIFTSHNNTIGGATYAHANKCCYNVNGIAVRFTSTGNNLLGNYVGTLADGLNHGNTDTGISIENSSRDNIIGGVLANQGNIIRYNIRGLWIVASATRNTVYGNTISNQTGDGISISQTATENYIGGLSTGQGNTISNNGGDGVDVLDLTSVRNTIRGNAISCNAGMGIKLNYGASQGNSGLASPIIKSNLTTATHIEGTAPANSIIDLYVVPTTCARLCANPLKQEGLTYFASVPANGSGIWEYNGAISGTLTATANNGLLNGYYNTSEFATCDVTCASSITSGAATVCAGSTSTYSTTDAGPYVWSVTGGTFTGQGTNSISVTFGTSSPATIELTSGTCSKATLNVTVNPRPTAPTAGSNSPVCVGGTINLTASTVAGATSYNWTGPNSFTSTAQNPIITNATSAMAGTYSVTVTVAGCTSLASTTSVTVNPIPTAPTAGSNSPVCVGGTINLTASTVAGATSYTWTGPNSFTSTTQNPTITGATSAMAGTYSVTVTTAGSGCTSLAATTSVTVNPRPTAPTAGSNSPVCVGGTINLTASTVAGATSYNWTGPNSFTSTTQNPTITGATSAMAGTYSVTVTTSGSGCTSLAATSSVTVNPRPTAPTAGSNGPLCIGGTINLTASTVAGATSYNWTGPNSFTSTTQNPTITGATSAMAGTYSVTVTTSGSGCTSLAATTSVTVNPVPTAPTAGSNSPVCVGGTINLTASTVAGATSYNWTGPNSFTSTSQNPTITGATSAMAGTYSVTVTTSGSGCTSLAATTSVTVNPIPTAPTAGSNSPVCVGGTINLTASTVAGATSYNWTGPNSFTSTTQNPTITGTTSAMAGTYSVTVTTSGSGCTSLAATTSVTVNPIPTVPTAGSNSPVCVGGTINLTASTVVGATSYNWTGPNSFTSTAQNPTITGATLSMAGTYSVTATASGCTSGSSSTTIIINPNPTVTISPNPVTICTGGSVNLVATGANGSASYNYTWSPATNLSSTNTATTTASPTSDITYTVIVTDANTCSSPAASVTVSVAPNLAPEISGSDELCMGSNNVRYFVSNQSSATSTFTWVATGGVTIVSNSGNEVFVNVGTTAGSLTVTETTPTCNGQDVKNITVNANPGTLSISGLDQVCKSTNLVSYSVAGSAGSTYVWSVPTGATIVSGQGTASIEVNFSSTAESGNITVTETNSSTCSGPANTKAIQINSRPDVQTIAGQSPVCVPSAGVVYSIVTLTDMLYDWNYTGTGATISGNGTNSITIDYSASATAGNVELVLENTTTGCTSLVSNILPVQINTRPDTDLISGTDKVCVGTEGEVFSVSNISGSTNWIVSTGGTIVSGQGTNSITVDFGSGVSEVTITAIQTNSSGCADLTASTITVDLNANPLALSIDGPDAVCPETTNQIFTVSTYNAASKYTWTVPVGCNIVGIADGETISVNVGLSPSPGNVTVEETDINGCKTVSPALFPITINPTTPLAVINGGDRDICTGPITVVGNDPGIPGITGKWSSVSATFGDPLSATTTASGFGASTNILRWTLEGECSTEFDEIEVRISSTSFSIDAIAAQDTLCLGAPADIATTISGSIAAPFTYTWTSSDLSFGTVTTNSSITVNPASAGWTKYYVSVIDANGCSANPIGVDSVYSIGKQDLVIPNLITPNGDYKNDCLIIRDANEFDIIPGAYLEMYNRWGESVYKNNHYQNGDFCGSTLADGMYYFYMKTSCDQREIKGWLHIISNEASNK